MTQRLACPPVAGPVEELAREFDPPSGSLARRRGLRDRLQGLLAPRERNKTVDPLAGTEPVVGAEHPDAQRLPFFLSEATWDPEAINTRRLELAAPSTCISASNKVPVAFTMAHRSCGTLPITSWGNHRFPNVLLSPLSFDARWAG
jgi:hypothetical protein